MLFCSLSLVTKANRTCREEWNRNSISITFTLKMSVFEIINSKPVTAPKSFYNKDRVVERILFSNYGCFGWWQTTLKGCLLPIQLHNRPLQTTSSLTLNWTSRQRVLSNKPMEYHRILVWDVMLFGKWQGFEGTQCFCYTARTSEFHTACFGIIAYCHNPEYCNKLHAHRQKKWDLTLISRL